MKELVVFLLPPEALLAHAAALMTAGPLLLAALVFGLRPRSGLIALLGTAFCAWLALGLTVYSCCGESLEYAFGGWEAPIGIAFSIDALNAFAALIIAMIGLLCSIANMAAAPVTPATRQNGHFHALFLLCLGALFGVVLTGDVFNLFVFVEISSLSSYALIALGNDRRALRAAFNYLIMGSIGASFYLIGIGFLYAVTGTLNMQDMARLLADTEHDKAVTAGLTFVVVGLGIKAALFPLHRWLPPSYGYAPPMVTAFLSGTATKAAIYALARILFGVFDSNSELVNLILTQILMPLAAAGIVVCTVQALLQTDVRKLLAYSSIAQSGYMLLAFSLGSFAGVAAALLHMFAHAAMKSTLFMALAGMAPDRQNLELSSLAGAGRSAPMTMAAFAICGLSLAGVPPTIGFVSKWALLGAIIESGQYWAAFLIVMTGIMAFIYVWKILEAAYLRTAPSDTAGMGEAPGLVLLPLLILAGANLLFGVMANIPVSLANAGALSLSMPDIMGGAP